MLHATCACMLVLPWGRKGGGLDATRYMCVQHACMHEYAPRGSVAGRGWWPCPGPGPFSPRRTAAPVIICVVVVVETSTSVVCGVGMLACIAMDCPTLFPPLACSWGKKRRTHPFTYLPYPTCIVVAVGPPGPCPTSTSSQHSSADRTVAVRPFPVRQCTTATFCSSACVEGDGEAGA